MPVAAPSNENDSPYWIFPRVWAIGLLILVSATWPLWFPGRSPELPLVPALPFLADQSQLAVWIANAASAGLVLCLLVLAVRYPAGYRWWWWLVAACLLVGFSVDQHRLQPWAYQSSIYAMIFASMDRDTAKRWIIPLAASIYIYSAAGKFDFQFAHTVGQEFLAAATDPFGGLPDQVSEAVRARLAMCFPTVELIAGIGILFARTRRFASGLVIAMHLTLIAILGPWNRDHSHGVLLWNVLLITQACLVLLPRPVQWPRPVPMANAVQMANAGPLPTSARLPAAGTEGVQDAALVSGQGPSAPRLSIGGVLVRMIVVTALVAPLLERRGFWDHWTSWSLYSPHTSHVDVELHQTAWSRLPASLQSQLLEDTNQDGWRVMDLGSWSLQSRRVPVYPQARYQLGLARAIASRYQLKEEIRARVLSVSNRWTGSRTEQELWNRSEINRAARGYWLLPAPVDSPES